MAKVIKLKDRSGSLVLPLTRSQLVQVSEISGLDLLNSKQWSKASVQDALEAIISYVNSNKASWDSDLTTIKNALEDVLSSTRAVANYADNVKNLAYAQSADDAKAAQDNAYAYAGKVAGEALAEVDVTVAAGNGNVLTGFEIEDGKLKANSITTTALTSSNVSRTATTGDHGVAATNVEGAIVELSTKVDTAYTNAEAYTDEKVNALKGTLNGTITTEAGKVFTSITQTNGVLSYTDAALTSSDITRTATTGAHGVAATTVEGAIQELAAAVDAGGTGSVVTVEEVTTGLDDSILKAYKIWQGSTSEATNLKGTINIPKDLVVTAGAVVNGTWSGDTFTEGSGTDKALKLTIANQTAPVYINPTDFIDVYTANNQTSEVTVAIDANNNVTATIGTVAASKISYNGSNVNTELTNINATLAAHQADLTSYQGRIASNESDLSAYNTRISALETAASGLSYTVTDDSSYISVTPSTSGGATTFTISTSDIASDTNLQALQTAYNNLNTELSNIGVFYEQIGSSTIDDTTLDTF